MHQLDYIDKKKAERAGNSSHLSFQYSLLTAPFILAKQQVDEVVVEDNY